jgi:hypothetical protein
LATSQIAVLVRFDSLMSKASVGRHHQIEDDDARSEDLHAVEALGRPADASLHSFASEPVAQESANGGLSIHDQYALGYACLCTSIHLRVRPS